MHIGFLTPEYPAAPQPEGGLATYTRKVGFALARRGHQVDIFVSASQNRCWTDGAMNVHELCCTYWPQSVQRRYIRGCVPLMEQLVSARRLAQSVWQHHLQTPFDILQTSCHKAPGFALRHNRQVPLVCRISSYAPLWRSANGYPHTFCESIRDRLEARLLLDADRAFSPSQLIAGLYEKRTGVTPQIIRTPIDSQEITVDDTYYQASCAHLKYVLFFGTLNRLKGIDLLAAVMPALLTKYKELAFVFVGRDTSLSGSTKAFAYLQAHCQAFADHLHYHPFLPKAKLYPIIANALGVLMPSRADNYPNACLEAQAQGVPVIGINGSSLEEMIVDGKTGFLAENSHVDSLGYAIERLLMMNEAERQTMKANISAAVQAHRAADWIGQLETFYQATIADFRKSH